MITVRLRMTLVAAAAALFVAAPLLPTQAEAQDRSRWRVLVANMKPTDDSRERFGERVSGHLRNMIDLPTHVAIPERDSDRSARQYDLRLGDLDCAFAIQLASMTDVPLIFCGDYEAAGDQFEFSGKFVTVPGGEEFVAGPLRVAQGDERGAARLIMDEFEVMVQTLQAVTFCGIEYNSSNFEQALDYCSRAVESAPESSQARFALARTHMELEQYRESLDQFQILLEHDPRDDRYLQNAGWVAAQLGDRDLARDYYHRYLEINPDDAAVRMNIAYELAQVDDFYGAMSLLDEGIERDPENLDFHEFYGSYAFRAALALQDALGPPAQDADATLNPQVAELYRTAIASLERVVEARGDETRAGYVVNSMRAYLQLGEPAEAIRLGERGTQIFPEDVQIWSQLADSRSRAGDVDGAIAALERVAELNPDQPNLRARMGNVYLQANRVDEGIDAIRRAHRAGEQTPDGLAQMLLGGGFQRVQANNFEPGVRLIEAAKELAESSMLVSQINFFHGYALMMQARPMQEAQTLQTAQRTLPMFQAAARYVEAGRQWANENPQSNVNQIAENIQRFIEIQEAVIERERRRGG
jgi:tetratricopeptide (TPR) repeat protein